MKALLLLPTVLVVGGCTFPLIGSTPRDAPSVPADGRIDHVWHVSAGTGVPETVVGWSRRARHVPGTLTDRRYELTVWRRERPGHWMPTTLFTDSPFPFLESSVRTADVTGDGHRDLLITIECNGCNHAVSTAAVYANVGGRMRRIYGKGFLDGSKGQQIGAPGRVITETAWGASKGMIWFDEPHYGPQSSICCPDYRVQTFLRWDGSRLRTVRTRKVSAEHDNFLGQRPVPAP
jgi:hypothetical protein